MPKKVVGIYLVKGGSGFFSQHPNDGYEMEVDEKGFPTDEALEALERGLWESTADEIEDNPDMKVSYYITDVEGNELEVATDIERDDLFH